MLRRSHILNFVAALVLASPALAQTGTTGQSGPPPGGVPPGSQQANTPGPVTQDQQTDPYVGDKDFVKNAAELSATEVHLGQLAQNKASSDAVKELGKKMVEANTQNGQQLKQAAAALKIQVSDDPPRKAKKAEDKLAKLSGGDFDHTYAKMAADEQKQAVKQFEREAKSGKVPEMKDFAAKKLPAEQERQKQAEELASAGTGAAARQK
jgi:putative membrane protein